MPKENIIQAAKAGHLSRVKDLAQLDSRLLSFRDKDGTSVLSWAAAMDHLDVVEFLASQGVDVNASNILGITPLHFAAHNGHLDMVKLLLSKGADPNALNREGITPVGSAIKGKHEDVAEYLRNLSVPVAIEKKNQKGEISR